MNKAIKSVFLFKTKLVLLMAFSVINNTRGQNIFSGEPVQVVGSMNSYSTNLSSNSTYRKITTQSGNPTDGRGQWVKTYFAASSGAQVTNANMIGGSGNGFLFISGPASNRFQNKWVFNSVTQAKLDTINNCNAYNSGNDMGLNMSTAGYYTFVFNDCGYTSANAKFFVAYTNNLPVSISTPTFSVGANNTGVVNFVTSSAPSTNERFFIRYTSGNDFSASSTSSIIQATPTNSPINTQWTATIPAFLYGSTVRFYIFSSTLSLPKLNAMSEMDKSLSCINLLDNSGANYSYTLLSKYSIGFRVDMSTQVCAGFDSVTVIGNHAVFGSWSNSFKLGNIPNSGLYALTLLLDSSSALQYKYRLHKNGLVTWESNFTTPSGNRELILNKDTILGNACFNSLSASCPNIPAPSNISFLTDLSKTTPDPQGRVYVMGNFTSPAWSAGALRMYPVKNMPGYFQRIVTNLCQTNIEFKFINGDSSLANTPESFPNPLQRACTVSNGAGGFNRTFTRTSSNPVNLYFVFDSCTTALPVSLIGFTAKIENEEVVLKWQTAWEQNNKGFWIEASKDAKTFETLGFVEGKGNSKQLNNYSYLVKANDNYEYFRLRQEDYDGAIEHSNILFVNHQFSNLLIGCIKNPIEDKICLNFKHSGTFNVLLTDFLGKIIYNEHLIVNENYQYFLESNLLNKGLYMLNITSESETFTQKLIKE